MQKKYGVVVLVAAVVVLLVSFHAGIAAEQKVQFKVPGVV